MVGRFGVVVDLGGDRTSVRPFDAVGTAFACFLLQGPFGFRGYARWTLWDLSLREGYIPHMAVGDIVELPLGGLRLEISGCVVVGRFVGIVESAIAARMQGKSLAVGWMREYSKLGWEVVDLYMNLARGEALVGGLVMIVVVGSSFHCSSGVVVAAVEKDVVGSVVDDLEYFAVAEAQELVDFVADHLQMHSSQ